MTSHQAVDEAWNDGVAGKVVIRLCVDKGNVLSLAPGKGLAGCIREIAQLTRRFEHPGPGPGADLGVSDLVQHKGNSRAGDTRPPGHVVTRYSLLPAGCYAVCPENLSHSTYLTNTCQ